MLKRIIAVTALAVGMLGVGVAPALAHHVVSVGVQVSCDGYAGSAVLNVFDNHKYRVTAPGFDTGLVTEPGSSHNVTVPFAGSATAGTVTATIYYQGGGVEAQQSKSFALQEECPVRTEGTVTARANMQRGVPSAPFTCVVSGYVGDGVVVKVTRAPGFLKLVVNGPEGSCAVRYAAKSGRNTVLKVDGLGLHLQVWSRLAGRAAQTSTYNTTLA